MDSRNYYSEKDRSKNRHFWKLITSRYATNTIYPLGLLIRLKFQQSSEYPALAAALHLLDEVFDLQARSQWLRRGLINRVLGAPWVSQTANKKIIQAAKSLIEVEKIDHLLGAIL